MGFFDRARAVFRGKKQQRDGTGFELSRWSAAPPRRGTIELLQAYKEMPWLRTVVDTVADSVASVSWRAYRRVDPGSGKAIVDYSLRAAPSNIRRERRKELVDAREMVEVPDHPVLKLLSDPNDHLTGRAITKLAQVHLDLIGESYLLLERRGNVVVGFWPLPPSWVVQLPDLRAPQNERVYRISVGGKHATVPAADVIALRHLDPDDPMGRGAGAAFALGDELDSDEYVARFVKASFFNNMVPPFIASIEGMNDANSGGAKAFKESLERAHRGADNAGKLLLTSGKVTLARLDTTFKDMNLVEVRKFLMGFVRMTYRVPPEILGDISNSNKATAYAAREILAEQVTTPRLEFLRSEFQKRLVPLFGDDIILDYDSPVPADREHALRVMGTMPMAFSFNEWREQAGMRPDPERQGYPAPMPGQKPEEPQQTPSPTEGSAEETAADEDDEKGIPADPAWAVAPLR